MNRRQMIAAAAAAMPLMTPRAARAADPAPPALTFAFRARVTLGPIIELGTSNGLRKRVVPITGGDFAGPDIRGEILNGGGDWQTILPDGTAQVHALYNLRTHDGVNIGIDNTGIRRGPADVLRRLAAGEDLDPSLYYFRTTPRFDVADGPYAWLRENLFVGVGARHPQTVDIDYFRLG
jgi:hypothetical protein